MSDGITHATASVILAVGFGAASLVSMDARILECSLGALAGIMLSPDLDLDARNISYKILRQKTGWLSETVWAGFWRGYRKSFKHGQFGSHFPIFSTFIRLSYIFFWIIFVPHLLIKLPYELGLLSFPNWSLTYVLSWYVKIVFEPLFVYGLVASDIIHYFLDRLTKESKA